VKLVIKYCFVVSLVLFSSLGFAQTNFTSAQGKDLYDNYCQTCHGEDMVNPGTVSYDLRKFPKDGKARFIDSVSNGKNGMPSWKSALALEDMERIWLYVLTQGK